VTRFRTFAIMGWSGDGGTGPAPPETAPIASVVRDGHSTAPEYLRDRRAAEDWLATLIEAESAAGRRLMLGFDIPFGTPKGFARALTGADDPFALWDWLRARAEAAPDGPDISGLPRDKTDGLTPFPACRQTEKPLGLATDCWRTEGADAPLGRMMTGLPVLARLRHRFRGRLAVWPFEPPDKPVVFVETRPSLTLGPPPQAMTGAARPTEHMALKLAHMPPEDLAQLLNVRAPEEGWILGVAPDLAPPPLRDDCFAMPRGVDWIPVDTALERLQAILRPVTGVETVQSGAADGRIIARDCIAARAHPPAANAAVDGYGFAHAAIGDGVQTLQLAPGRAAAGRPFAGAVPHGAAIRILTGAALPEGVDTVVLEEDTTTDGARIAFAGPGRAFANTRAAGEDVQAGDPVLCAGRLLRPPDIALLAACGIGEVAVHRRLRVGVLSTGDELLADPSVPAGPYDVYDANRPMLLSLVRRWGYEAVDLGHAPDDTAEIAARLDRGAARADAILVSGGASAGDEDHVSRLLRDRGALSSWRVAMKPGRPLALALWGGAPVFGLPGNPVAAFVCALIFARPALSALSGAGWVRPFGFEAPAAFGKSKKPGRREYLRARLDAAGRVEVFRSEGSGRISGLVWATGLAELPDGAVEVTPGAPVRFLPYAGFGL